MALNTNGSCRLRTTAGTLPAAGVSWVARFHGKFGTTAGTNVILALSDAWYLYGDGTNLVAQSTSCGAIPTTWGSIVLRHDGSTGTTQVYRRAAGAITYTLIGTDAFGTGAVTSLDLFGDAVFGPAANFSFYDFKMWSGGSLPTNTELATDDWNYHTVLTTGLIIHYRCESIAGVGTATVGTNATVTGTPTLEAATLLVVSDSVGAAGVNVGGPFYSRGWAQTAGLINATQVSNRSFIRDGSLAIPGIKMEDHASGINVNNATHAGFSNYTGLAVKLAALPPGCLVVLFGGLNDFISGTSASTTKGYFDTLAGVCKAYGAIPIGVGPTDAPAWSSASFGASLRSLIVADTTNYSSTWNVGTVAGGVYGDPSTNDGVHPPEANPGYDSLDVFGEGKINDYLTGAVPFTLLSTSPVDDEVGFAVGAAIQFSWSTAPVDSGSGSFYLRLSSDDSLVQQFSSGQFTIDGLKVKLQPSSPLAYGTDYYIEADAGVVESSTGDPSPAITGSSALNFTSQNTPVGVIGTSMAWAWSLPIAHDELMRLAASPWLIETMWGDGGVTQSVSTAAGEAAAQSLTQVQAQTQTASAALGEGAAQALTQVQAQVQSASAALGEGAVGTPVQTTEQRQSVAPALGEGEVGAPVQTLEHRQSVVEAAGEGVGGAPVQTVSGATTQSLTEAAGEGAVSALVQTQAQVQSIAAALGEATAGSPQQDSGQAVTVGLGEATAGTLTQTQAQTQSISGALGEAHAETQEQSTAAPGQQAATLAAGEGTASALTQVQAQVQSVAPALAEAAAQLLVQTQAQVQALGAALGEGATQTRAQTVEHRQTAAVSLGEGTVGSRAQTLEQRQTTAPALGEGVASTPTQTSVQPGPQTVVSAAAAGTVGSLVQLADGIQDLNAAVGVAEASALEQTTRERVRVRRIEFTGIVANVGQTIQFAGIVNRDRNG